MNYIIVLIEVRPNNYFLFPRRRRRRLRRLRRRRRRRRGYIC